MLFFNEELLFLVVARGNVNLLCDPRGKKILL